MSKEVKYYGFEEILKKLNLYHDFNNKHEYLPQVFNHKIEEFDFSWGEIIIPKKGIRETVMNALSKNAEKILDELKFLWIIPYKLDKISPITKREISTYGNIYHNISLTFRYDKTWKWGEITNTIEECCFFILEYAKDIGDFYIITGKDNVQDFINQVIIPNQYGTRCEWASEILPACVKPKSEDDPLPDTEIKIVNKNEESGKTIVAKVPDGVLPDGYCFQNQKNIIKYEDEDKVDAIKATVDVNAELAAMVESVKNELAKQLTEDLFRDFIKFNKHGEDLITKSVQTTNDVDETEKDVLDVDKINEKWKLYFDADASHPTNPCSESVPKDDKE